MGLNTTLGRLSEIVQYNAMTLSIRPIPVAGTAYMRAIGDDLTVVCRLGLLAKEEIFMCFGIVFKFLVAKLSKLR